MYSNNFVLAVKANGKVLREFYDSVYPVRDRKVLREFYDSVYIPFGTEYTIFLKNLTSRRAKVHVYIDGEDALGGSSIVVNGMESTDLKRFIKNGNLNAGNSFKFIEKTEKISKHRGDHAEDGLITIEYEFEVEAPKWVSQQAKPYQDYPWSVPGQLPPCNPVKGMDVWYQADTDANRGIAQSVTTTSRTLTANYSSGILRSSANTIPTALTATQGITAPGSINDQKFTTVYSFIGDGVKYTMTIKLQGEVEEKVVKKPVTVKRVTRCTMCGTHVKQTAKFCHECGASVTIV